MEALRYFTYNFQCWPYTVFYSEEPMELAYEQLTDIIRCYIEEYNSREFYITINNVIQEKDLLKTKMCIPFFDYDCNAITETKKEVLSHVFYDMHRLHLSGFIFETLNGYHVVCNQLMRYELYLSILEQSGCCNGFKFYARNDQARLRIGAKPLRVYDIQKIGYYDNVSKQLVTPLYIEPYVEKYLIVRDYIDRQLRYLYIYNNGLVQYNLTDPSVAIKKENYETARHIAMQNREY